MRMRHGKRVTRADLGLDVRPDSQRRRIRVLIVDIYRVPDRRAR